MSTPGHAAYGFPFGLAVLRRLPWTVWPRWFWCQARLALAGIAARRAYARRVAAERTDLAAACRAQREALDQAGALPRIAVLVPVYDPPLDCLRRCLDSVLGQVYANWELCFCDDASSQPEVRALLADYAARDTRISGTFRERNGHISTASNDALALAAGDYLALLDHDDELSPLALGEIALALAAHPGWQIVYTDEDKIDRHGRRFDPHRKPAWNAELLLGQNYVGHLVAYRTALVRGCGGFREGYEGSQDHDLALRASERLAADAIGHIPEVLYHWRALPGSTAARLDAKHYAGDAARRAVQDALVRRGIDAEVLPLPGLPGHFRLRHRLPPRDLRVLRIGRDADGAVVEAERIEGRPDAVGGHRWQVVPDSLRRFDPPLRTEADIAAMIEAQPSDVIVTGIPGLYALSDESWHELVSQALRPDVEAVGGLVLDGAMQHASGLRAGANGTLEPLFASLPFGAAGPMQRARLVQETAAVAWELRACAGEHDRRDGTMTSTCPPAAAGDAFPIRSRHVVWTPYACFGVAAASHGAAATGHHMSSAGDSSIAGSDR